MSARFDKFMIHVDIGTDEKLAGFSDSERLCHIAGVLAIAAKSPMRGCLIVGDLEATPEHVARRAGVTPRVAKSTIKKLTDAGVLIRDDDMGCLRVHNWERFNPPPKEDKGNAERQARWRKRQAERNAGSNALRNGALPASNAGEVEGEVRRLKTTPLTPQGGNAGIDVPARPTGGRRRDVDGYEQAVDAFACSLFPDADPVACAAAVRSVLGRGWDFHGGDAEIVKAAALEYLPMQGRAA